MADTDKQARLASDLKERVLKAVKFHREIATRGKNPAIVGKMDNLVAWLEVRAYKGGRVEVMPWIENGYLNVAGPTAKSGTASFTLNGSQRFSQSLNLLNHQRAVLASGTTLTHWTGGTDPQVTPRHNTSYLMATKLVPNYRGVTASGSTLFSRLASSYTPLMQGNYQTDMPSSGGTNAGTSIITADSSNPENDAIASSSVRSGALGTVTARPIVV